MRKRTVFWFISVVFMISCSTSKFGRKTELEPIGKEAKTSPYVEDFDPNALNDDDINPALDKALIQQASKTSKSSRAASEPEKTSTEAIVNGYRIQLLATKDENLANEMKKQAILKFQDKVYLIFESPYYRIRVGDCISEKDAKVLREEAVKKGFTDAWIVPSKVINRGEGDSNP